MTDLVDLVLEKILRNYKEEDETLEAIEQIKLLFIGDANPIICECVVEGVPINVKTIPTA